MNNDLIKTFQFMGTLGWVPHWETKTPCLSVIAKYVYRPSAKGVEKNEGKIFGGPGVEDFQKKRTTRAYCVLRPHSG